VTLAAYNGHEALTFADYLDLGTGRSLRAEPGGTYDVAPASGRVVPEVPEPWFTAVSAGATEVQVETVEAVEPGEGEGAPAEGDGAPDPGEQEAGEPAHDEDPETDTSPQF